MKRGAISVFPTASGRLHGQAPITVLARTRCCAQTVIKRDVVLIYKISLKYLSKVQKRRIGPAIVQKQASICTRLSSLPLPSLSTLNVYTLNTYNDHRHSVIASTTTRRRVTIHGPGPMSARTSIYKDCAARTGTCVGGRGLC